MSSGTERSSLGERKGGRGEEGGKEGGKGERGQGREGGKEGRREEERNSYTKSLQVFLKELDFQPQGGVLRAVRTPLKKKPKNKKTHLRVYAKH